MFTLWIDYWIARSPWILRAKPELRPNASSSSSDGLHPTPTPPMTHGNPCGTSASWMPSKTTSPPQLGNPFPHLMPTSPLPASTPPRLPRLSTSCSLLMSLRGRSTLSGGLCKGIDLRSRSKSIATVSHSVTCGFLPNSLEFCRT